MARGHIKKRLPFLAVPFLRTLIGLGDSTRAEITTIGEVARVEGVRVSTFGESIDVDAVAVPISWDIDCHFLVYANSRIRENSRFCFGTIHEDISNVIAIRANDGCAVIDGNVDLQRVLESRVAVLNLGEVSLSEFEVFVVYSDTALSITMDSAPILLHEEAALRGLRTFADVLKSQHNSRRERCSELSTSSECIAHNLLCIGVWVTDFRIVHAHYLEIAPFAEDIRARFLLHSPEVVSGYNCHNFEVLCFGSLLAT